MSMRLSDISRWPIPPIHQSAADSVLILSPFSHTWQLMPIHLKWLKECTTKYGFDDMDETLRHLIYLSNSECSKNKRLIFKIKRCLHCHVGARLGQHTKVSLQANVHRFQWQWLQNVTTKCDIDSVEKCVRIICDFYQSRVKEVTIQSGEEAGQEREEEFFGKNRSCDKRLHDAILQWKTSNDENAKVNENKEKLVGCDLKDLATDPAACSERETLFAIKKCQIGKNSASYATALGETTAQTAKRRAKERKIEQSDKAKKNRDFIRKALRY